MKYENEKSLVFGVSVALVDHEQTHVPSLLAAAPSAMRVSSPAPARSVCHHREETTAVRKQGPVPYEDVEWHCQTRKIQTCKKLLDSFPLPFKTRAPTQPLFQQIGLKLIVLRRWILPHTGWDAAEPVLPAGPTSSPQSCLTLSAGLVLPPLLGNGAL